MVFDKEISEWILEYLLREVTDTTLITRALSVLPIPETSPVLIKTVSLKTLDSFIHDGSVSESILDILERIAKVYSDEEHGLVFLDESIKLAYCMVAVDCTLRFNEGTGNDVGPYLEAVKRIWRGRIGYLEKSSYAELIVSDQLRTWRDDIEAAVYDDSVSKRIITINTRLEALKALKLFVTEAWKVVGSRPTFLEQVAKKMGRSLLVSQNLAHVEKCNLVQEGSPCLSDMQIENERDQRNVRDQDQTVEENTVAVPVPTLTHKGVENSNVLPQLKHVAGKSKHSKRVQIGDAEDLTGETLRNRVALLGSAEVSKVQEALLSSSLGLQALAKDPLPEALSLAGAVRSGIGRNLTNAEPSAVHTKEKSIAGPTARHENDDKIDETHVDARPASSLVNKNSKAIDDIGTKRSYEEVNNATRGGLMPRNDTAQTYEWEDLDELDTPEGPSSSKRLRLPRPKPITVSPLKKYVVGRRRNNRRWSAEEEDVLRSGVDKFGKGSWKMILCAYREIFEERTEVDLKDKWRNMMKHAA